MVIARNSPGHTDLGKSAICVAYDPTDEWRPDVAAILQQDSL